MRSELEEGVRLFNSQKFFEAHEAWEAVWLTARGQEKVFLQGIIQVAAAFHHQQQGNRPGATGLLEKGWRKLLRFGPERHGLDLEALRTQLKPWRDHFRFPRSAELPSTYPRLVLRSRAIKYA